MYMSYVVFNIIMKSIIYTVHNTNIKCCHVLDQYSYDIFSQNCQKLWNDFLNHRILADQRYKSWVCVAIKISFLN